MSLNNFIPVVWAGMVLSALEKELVYAQTGVVNTDYEGDIREQGDRVRINSVGDVTIKTYTKNTDIDAPEALTSSQQELIIDQAKYFNMAVDDVDVVQTKPKIMQEAMDRAAYGLRDVADTFLGGLMNSSLSAANANRIGTESAPKTDLGTAGKAYEYLVDLSVILSNNNTPSTGRWVIVPPWFYGQLQRDARFVGSGSAAADTRLMNGFIGEAVGLRVFQSNNVPFTTATTKFKIIAGHSIAVSYADQIVSVEAFRPERRFADAVRGIHVYGAKVVRPSNLAILIANLP